MSAGTRGVLGGDGRRLRNPQDPREELRDDQVGMAPPNLAVMRNRRKIGLRLPLSISLLIWLDPESIKMWLI